jgi:predicted Zn-dependent protease
LESKAVTVNGLPALAIVADQQQDPQQQQQAQGQELPVVRTLTYLIQHGGAIYAMLGASSATDFNTYASHFSSTMQGFRPLTDQAKLNKQPERVRIKTVRQSSTLAQALRANSVPDKRLEELAILNGMQLTDKLNSGMLIKVIE